MILSGTQAAFEPTFGPSEEHAYLRHLMVDPVFSDKYLSFFIPEYFKEPDQQLVFTALRDYITKYNSQPTSDLLKIECGSKHGAHNEDAVEELIDAVAKGDLYPTSWINDKAEAFIQYRNYEVNTVLGMNAGRKNEALRKQYAAQAATEICFTKAFDGIDSYSPGLMDILRGKTDTSIVIPFDLRFLNEQLSGCRRETFNVVVGSTNSGKSLWLCHFAASYLRRKLNVLYFTMEMSRDIATKRIHANLLDVPLSSKTERLLFEEDTDQFTEYDPRGHGQLIVKKFPSGMAHAGDFRSYVVALKKSHHFVPDVIIVDYLGIIASELTKPGAGQQNYSIVNSAAKELCALACQTNTVVWTGAQANRTGTSTGDIELIHVADAFALTNHADIILSIGKLDKKQFTEEPYYCRILKHQSGSVGSAPRSLFRCNPSKMKLRDMIESERISYEEVQEKYKNKYKDIVAKKATPVNPRGKIFT